MKQLSPNDIIQQYVSKDYILKNGNYEMNIFAIRTNDNEANTFNDSIGLLFKDERKNWQLKIWDCTTDAGTFYRLTPINVNGTAIIVPGQYIGAYKIGLHKNYEAMQQIGNMKYIRDNNRNKILDWVYDKIGYKYEVAVNATNIHHAGVDSVTVDNWSAGCIVFKRISEFNIFMSLVKSSRDNYKYNNLFDFTLFEEQDFNGTN